MSTTYASQVLTVLIKSVQQATGEQKQLFLHKFINQKPQKNWNTCNFG